MLNLLTDMIGTLADWRWFDTWTVITAALAAMACALPGTFLLLRRQSMMGDALSHAALPGIVIAFLLAHWSLSKGFLSSESYASSRSTIMFLGAIVLGMLTAFLSQWVERLGRVEANASLGVVFTTLFAVGLLLIRLSADDIHIDPDCVLYGTIETVVLEPFGDTDIPRAAVVNGTVLLINLLLVVIFFKELRITTFDPALATTLEINAGVFNYAVMGITAATLVTAFESVGSILVIAMLIVPPAVAHLLTDRLAIMIIFSLIVATSCAVLGHVFAISLPSPIFERLGFDGVEDASTAGMMAVAAGFLFLVAILFAPRHGVLSKFIDRILINIRITLEDVLGILYRLEELRTPKHAESIPTVLHDALGVGRVWGHLALWKLRRDGRIAATETGYQLTDIGRRAAQSLVRAHRLWESYLEKHFELPSDHLHSSAQRTEHFIGPQIQKALAAELENPNTDPHGQGIPPAQP